MLCRVTNDQPQPRVFYNSKRKPVNIEPGATVTMEMTLGDYEFARERALARVGPQIEVLRADPEPEPPIVESEQAEPVFEVRPKRRYVKRVKRRRKSRQIEQETSDG